eukprot:1476422-Prymnesium_polylepis.1
MRRSWERCQLLHRLCCTGCIGTTLGSTGKWSSALRRRTGDGMGGISAMEGRGSVRALSALARE